MEKLTELLKIKIIFCLKNISPESCNLIYELITLFTCIVRNPWDFWWCLAHNLIVSYSLHNRAIRFWNDKPFLLQLLFLQLIFNLLLIFVFCRKKSSNCNDYQYQNKWVLVICSGSKIYDCEDIKDKLSQISHLHNWFIVFLSVYLCPPGRNNWPSSVFLCPFGRPNNCPQLD